MGAAESRVENIRRLQKQILVMQGLARISEKEKVKIGLPAIEQSFPNQTFPTGAIHEFISHTLIDGAATNGFLAGLISFLAQNKGICFWISIQRRLFPPALKNFGIAPERVVFIDVSREKEALWTIEEALKCKAVAAVVGELSNFDFTASRRLQLAVEQSHVTGFIHRIQPKTESPVACVSRWKITPLASIQEDGDAPGVGFARWNVQLLKVRNGQPGSWQIEWTGDGFQQVAQFTRSQSQQRFAKTA